MKHVRKTDTFVRYLPRAVYFLRQNALEISDWTNGGPIAVCYEKFTWKQQLSSSASLIVLDFEMANVVC